MVVVVTVVSWGPALASVLDLGLVQLQHSDSISALLQDVFHFETQC